MVGWVVEHCNEAGSRDSGVGQTVGKQVVGGGSVEAVGLAMREAGRLPPAACPHQLIPSLCLPAL